MHDKHTIEAIERVAERLYIEFVDEADIHSNRIPSWIELSEESRERWRNDVILMPYLCDRADGVKGHYAIGRLNPAGYHEYWNLRSLHWTSCSDEILLGPEARRLRDKLKLEVEYERAKRRDYRGYEIPSR